MNIAAVILAAGLSSRMGAFKPLIRLGERSMLGHCRMLFHECGLDEILAVVGHRADETAAEAESLGMMRVQNNEYHTGMFSSIQCAAAALPTNIEAFFILPVDIPLVRAATIKTILAAFPGEDEAVFYPLFAGRRGHPPLIPATLIPAILNHDGVGGLEALLGQYKGIDVAVWDEGILMDADTPKDLERLQQRQVRLSIPNRQEINTLAGQLLSEQGLAHGHMVGRTAAALAQALNDQGYGLDMDLLYGAALLHDVAKGQSRHEIKGAELLAALGLAEIAAIVAAHTDLEPRLTSSLTEKELVCLADKFISGSRRIQIEERYAEKLEIFAGNAAICREIRGRRERALALKDFVEQKLGRSVETIL
ncbi:MAG: NTP transferase domain-containing protein, partial [Desulfoprunum sp.]|nr:NTP transferase domain-containing protein [Desulfoprunum sp.]